MKIKSIFFYLYSFTSEDWEAFIGIAQKEFEQQPELLQLVKKASRKKKQLKLPITGDIGRRLFDDLYQKKNYAGYLNKIEKRIEQFFRDQVVQRDELLLSSIQRLLRFSNRKGLEHFFLNEVRSFEIQMNDLPYLTKDHYFALHLLNDKAHFLHHGNKEKQSYHSYLWKSSYYLKIYQLFYAIKAHVESHFLHRIYKVDPTLEVKHNAKELIEQTQYHAQNPLIQLYLNILKGIHISFNLQDFKALGNQFDQLATHLPDQERIDLVGFIMNLAAKKINSGDGSYRVPCLQLYLKWTREDLLFINGLFSDQTYLSVVDLAANLKAYEDLDLFKKKVEDKLSIEKRDQFIKIGNLTEYFNKELYRKCTELYHMQQIPSEPSLKMRVRILLLRSHFMVAIEDKERKSFYTEVENFRGYCNYSRQEDMGEDRKKLLTNLKDQLLMVFQAYESGKWKINPEQKEKLRQTISSTEMYGRPWLLKVLKGIAEA